MRRKISYSVLHDVLVKGKHAHLVLKAFKLDAQDQAFVSALVYTALQHKMYLEYQFDDFIDNKTPDSVRIVLLIAACQYYKMRDIPEYAIVNESVNLMKAVGQKRYSGLVNAVLKKMIQRKERAIDGDALDVASIQYSMPLWILKLLKGQYSESFALEYAQYCQSIKPTYGWMNQLVDHHITEEMLFLDVDKKIVKPEVFQSDYLEHGVLVIQDINSQDVVNSFDIVEGMDVLDCCCAPGTKTLRLANRLKNTGSIIGVDLHESRVLKTQDLMERTGVTNTRIIQGDAATIAFESLFDIVLVDAPCSGLGVLSHKHDLRYHIKPSDLDELQSIQYDILQNTSKVVKPGGLLVYATCTLNRKENEKQIQRFIEAYPEFECVYEKTYNPMDTLGDGFYVAHCRKSMVK
ncbi:rRNA methyltransferase [Erysipelothrix larvae]|uniref:rRNA methyltransferase n=1 Tax=Erysipelothrix larvae TaxID=1514105 RepID=A0A0X8GZX0_9FIRM|nr:transcription antitermination factor NusB [Erysipelothrix larvae]AMC93439.1 rRNA methyltransferase [Erysipelothrix larvae]